VTSLRKKKKKKKTLKRNLRLRLAVEQTMNVIGECLQGSVAVYDMAMELRVIKVDLENNVIALTRTLSGLPPEDCNASLDCLPIIKTEQDN
jgi:hypothetical protein